ncbi:hypothetical protein [Deinococcus sp.]|uniref:hypothetical protein n=1 Tax=Deinococcus sp. TaxID=47478 RepID=UPI003C7E73CC
MKNLRYLITVLALVNAGLIAQAAAAPTASNSAASTGKTTTSSASGLYGFE